MPALPAVPKVVRLDFAQLMGEDIHALNRLFVQYTGTAPSISDLSTFATAVATAWGTDIKGLLSIDETLLTVEATDLSSATASRAIAIANLSGTDAGAPLAAETCFVLDFLIARRYRGGKPRWYGGIVTQPHLLDPQRWEQAFITSWESDFAAFIALVVGAGWTGAGTLSHVSVSYYHLNSVVIGPTGRARNVPQPRAVPLIDAVTGYRGNPVTGSQRRRSLQRS
jgi:hypothetical protein